MSYQVQPQLPVSTKFADTLRENKLTITRGALETVQVNIGKLCNQACSHCHVEAGPKRTEIMNQATLDRVLELLSESESVKVVDITGGAPELNPRFRYFVDNICGLQKSVIDRCNLTVLFEPGQEDTASYLAEKRVRIVASLPCYSKENVDKQRGSGVFEKSIRALRELNDLGYGIPDTGLILDLVYNPIGATLPPSQISLESDYKEMLRETFSIEFNNLYTITNMPIKRFAHFLFRRGEIERYMQLLVDSFNTSAVANVMCRNMISIGWDGKLYDCDFNQMLDLPTSGTRDDIWKIGSFSDLTRRVVIDEHCYGCTAGCGSSCNGTLT